MSQRRLLLLFGLLAVVLGIRWWDPLGRSELVQTVSEPVERIPKVARASTTPAASSLGPMPIAWPVRTAKQDKDVGNAFMTRAEVAQLAIKRQPVVAPPPPPPPYVQPPPPPPVEPPPPLQVIGTWGDANNLAVFLSSPNGTVLAHPGDVLLSQYRVQNITQQQVTLLQNSNQRIWNIAIPAAPANLQTWPGR